MSREAVRCSIAHYNRLILTYLIPCRLITQHAIPSAKLLAEAPGLARLIGPLVACIKKGDLTGFDKALVEGEPEFVRRRIFLTLERSRDIALRNLLRKVYLAAGYDDLKEGQTVKDRIRKSRIPLLHFATALRMGIAGEGSGQAMEDDEVECLLANQIYKVRTTSREILAFAHLACRPMDDRILSSKMAYAVLTTHIHHYSPPPNKS